MMIGTVYGIRITNCDNVISRIAGTAESREAVSFITAALKKWFAANSTTGRRQIPEKLLRIALRE